MPIANHSYDESTQSYRVQFKDGGPIYIYSDVDVEKANAIQAADSDQLGKIIQSELVRSDHPFTKIEPDALDDEGSVT